MIIGKIVRLPALLKIPSTHTEKSFPNPRECWRWEEHNIALLLYVTSIVSRGVSEVLKWPSSTHDRYQVQYSTVRSDGILWCDASSTLVWIQPCLRLTRGALSLLRRGCLQRLRRCVTGLGLLYSSVYRMIRWSALTKAAQETYKYRFDTAVLNIWDLIGMRSTGNTCRNLY